MISQRNLSEKMNGGCRCAAITVSIAGATATNRDSLTSTGKKFRLADRPWGKSGCLTFPGHQSEGIQLLCRPADDGGDEEHVAVKSCSESLERA